MSTPGVVDAHLCGSEELQAMREASVGVVSNHCKFTSTTIDVSCDTGGEPPPAGKGHNVEVAEPQELELTVCMHATAYDQETFLRMTELLSTYSTQKLTL